MDGEGRLLAICNQCELYYNWFGWLCRTDWTFNDKYYANWRDIELGSGEWRNELYRSI